jgi:hypothetical protein
LTRKANANPLEKQTISQRVLVLAVVQGPPAALKFRRTGRDVRGRLRSAVGQAPFDARALAGLPRDPEAGDTIDITLETEWYEDHSVQRIVAAALVDAGEAGESRQAAAPATRNADSPAG